MSDYDLATQPWFGRMPSFDEASRDYPARTLLARDQQAVRTKTWRRGGAYNQGPTPHCVAYTGKGLLNTAPYSGLVDYDVRSKYSTDTIYAGAQRLDEWPGENYDGTSGLGLMKHLQSVGKIAEYRWCFGVSDVLLTLSHVGPVALGVWWYEGMLETTDGYLHVEGAKVGGHEVELIGVDLEAGCVIGMNSWGTDWGVNGRFRLTWPALDALLHDDGDAVVITK